MLIRKLYTSSNLNSSNLRKFIEIIKWNIWKVGMVCSPINFRWLRGNWRRRGSLVECSSESIVLPRTLHLTKTTHNGARVLQCMASCNLLCAYTLMGRPRNNELNLCEVRVNSFFSQRFKNFIITSGVFYQIVSLDRYCSLSRLIWIAFDMKRNGLCTGNIRRKKETYSEKEREWCYTLKVELVWCNLSVFLSFII